MNIIDEDLCAKCKRCTLLEEVGQVPWNTEASCEKGFPFTVTLYNIVSDCKEFVKL